MNDIDSIRTRLIRDALDDRSSSWVEAQSAGQCTYGELLAINVNRILTAGWVIANKLAEIDRVRRDLIHEWAKYEAPKHLTEKVE